MMMNNANAGHTIALTNAAMAVSPAGVYHESDCGGLTIPPLSLWLSLAASTRGHKPIK
jgi:hypothetical protein